MKIKTILASLFLAVSAFGQGVPISVQKYGDGTNDLNAPFNVRSGTTIEYRSGSTLKIDSGATFNAGSGTINWSALTSTPTSAAGYGITNGAQIDTWGTKTNPTGTVIGTTDAQALTNKTFDTASNTFKINGSAWTSIGSGLNLSDGVLTATGGGGGTVTAVSIATANGFSGSSSGGATPALTIVAGAITPTSVNGNTITTGTGTLTLGTATLNAGTGGTLGSAAFTATSAYQTPLTFSTGLTNADGTVTANAVNLAGSGTGGVTGVTSVTNGGTGTSALTAGTLLGGNGTSPVLPLTLGGNLSIADGVINAVFSDLSVPMYLYATFTSETNNTLQLAYSYDGVDWSMMGQSLYTPASGGLRDPAIYLNPVDGYYYIFYTAGNFGNVAYFSIIKSSDLVNWTFVQNVSTASVVTDPGSGGLTWGPIPYTDPSGNFHIFVSLSTDNESTLAMYEVHPSTTNLSGSWTNPVAITGTNLPTRTICGSVQYIAGTYYIWYKNDSTKYMEILSSSSLLSGYTVYKSGDWAGWGSGIEGGASLVNTGGSDWTVVLDRYDRQGLEFSASADNWATWTPLQLVSQPVATSNPSAIFTTNAKIQFNILAAATYGNTVGGYLGNNAVFNGGIYIGNPYSYPNTTSAPWPNGFYASSNPIFLSQGSTISSSGAQSGYQGTIDLNANSYFSAPDGYWTEINTTLPAWSFFLSAGQDTASLYRMDSGTGTVTNPWKVDNAGDETNLGWNKAAVYRPVSYTVSTLPASPATGEESMVSDATAFTPGSAPTGSGSVTCPVYYNGSAWIMY